MAAVSRDCRPPCWSNQLAALSSQRRASLGLPPTFLAPSDVRVHDVMLSEGQSPLAEREPWLVGFTCYIWNIERTLWVGRELKRIRPEVRIVLGGPEITADNSWVLGGRRGHQLIPLGGQDPGGGGGAVGGRLRVLLVNYRPHPMGRRRLEAVPAGDAFCARRL